MPVKAPLRAMFLLRERLVKLWASWHARRRRRHAQDGELVDVDQGRREVG
jgi:hypothetical protein